MAKTKFNYGWTLKWILAAILIAAGILTKLNQENIVYATTGIAVVLFSAFRVVPLMKTLKKEVLRTMNLIEIIFEFILGVLMVYVGFFVAKPIPDLWVNLYGYMLTFFLLVRGVIYFVSLYYFQEKTEPAKFWTHLLFVAVGPVILTLTILDPDSIINTLGWLLLLATIGGAIYLGFDGYGGYKKYREKSKSLNTKKKKEIDSEVEKELPKPIQDEVEEKETYIN